MKTLDIWDHPLVVKAGRVRYRKQGIYAQVGIAWFLILIGLVCFHFYRADLGGPLWLRNYFIVLVGLQLLGCSLAACATTYGSMDAEVKKQTLDFQRITGLSPRQILVGKAIGEPVICYILIIITVPVISICWGMGGFDFSVALLLYLNLLTSTFMMACLGLQHPLKVIEKKQTANQSGAVGAVVAVGFVFIAGAALSGLGSPYGGALFGLLTPIPAITSIVSSNDPTGSVAWSVGFPFFGIRIPYLLLTPIMQCLFATFLLKVMSRRLTHELDTAVSKPMAFGMLAAVLFLLIAATFDLLLAVPNLTPYLIGFFAGLALFVLICIGTAAPSRESYQSWIWRLRGKRRKVWDLLVGERTLSWLTNISGWFLGAALGIAAATAIVVLQPQFLKSLQWPALLIAAALSLLLCTCYGLLHQVAAVATGNSIAAVMVVFFVLLTISVVPLVVGHVAESPELSSLSPVATYVQLIQHPADYYPPYYIMAVHVFAIMFLAWGMAGMSRRYCRLIDGKLAEMGATDHPDDVIR